jgi:UDP-3-O-[3-hydroxymyristoyl] glucosamine N-acyltransferase
LSALGELAAEVGGEVRGDGGREIEGVAALATAGPAELALWADARLRREAAASAAGALLVGPALAGDPAVAGRDLLVAADPRFAFARLLARFHPRRRPAPGVHPTAVVGEGCAIAPGAHVGPYAVLGAGTVVADGAVVEALVAVGRDCRIGRGAWLHPHVVLYDGSELGDGVEVHAGAVVGADGFGYATHDGVHHKVPQVGRVVVEREVEIGANAAVDRATLEETRIGAGSKLDNLVQVGHNVVLGRGCILSGQAGIAGSARLGDGVVLGGQAGVSGHLDVGDGVQVAGKSAVFESVPAGATVGGVPAGDLGRWKRLVVLQGRLEELFRRVRALERKEG